MLFLLAAWLEETLESKSLLEGFCPPLKVLLLFIFCQSVFYALTFDNRFQVPLRVRVSSGKTWSTLTEVSPLRPRLDSTIH